MVHKLEIHFCFESDGMEKGLKMVVEPFRREKKNPLDLLRAVDYIWLERV